MQLKTIFISSLIFTAYNLFSQNIAVENMRENIAYPGIENPLSIVVENTPCEALYVTTNNGKITGEDCRYDYMPNEVGGSKIYVHKIEKKDTILIRERNMRVKPLPLPKARLAGASHIPALKAQDGIIAYNEGYDSRVNIIQFNMRVIRKNDLLCDIENIGGKFNEDCRAQLDNIKPGDKLIIDNIMVLMPGMKTAQKLEDIVVEVE